MIRFNKYQKIEYLNSLDRSHFKELDDLEDTDDNRKAYIERSKRTSFKVRNAALGEKREKSPLNENYATLAWAITNFRTPSKHSIDDKKEFLRQYLGTGFMEHKVLLSEYHQAMNDAHFPWREFLTVNEAISPDNAISDTEAKNYAQSLLSDVLDELPEILKEVDG